MNKLSTIILFLGVLSITNVVYAQSEALPQYKKTQNLQGNISSIGSDTLANMMTFWAESFKQYHPGVNIQIQASGSSTAPIALTEGTSSFGPMSRPMKRKEVAAFKRRYGYEPTAIRVAIDALAIFVHKDNPLTNISLAQVDAIFSTTRRCAYSKNIKKWSQLGLSAHWLHKDIQLYGRNSVSGTYGFFKQKALCSGDFKKGVNEQPGSASVVQSVSYSVNAMGYSGIGYVTSGVKALAITNQKHKTIPAEPSYVISGEYPLTRFLYLYINKPPQAEIPIQEAEFIQLILSKTGQNIVEKDGYIALTSSIIETELKKLDLTN